MFQTAVLPVVSSCRIVKVYQSCGEVAQDLGSCDRAS